ncbi:MAG: T9SS type A sorting domain-containing protein [Melioribacteraceae bacterium]|nr:T9SS type A sorting domain-containing protein [Melioribacteraceae bacterium]
MKRLLLFCFLTSVMYAQPASVEITVVVSDNYGWSNIIQLGADIDASDGIDSAFGEFGLPPFKPPMPSAFAAWRVNAEYSHKDIKQGPSSPYSGSLIYQLELQAVDDNPLMLNWSTPTDVTTEIRDGVTGGLIFAETFLSGNNNYSISNVNSLPFVHFILHFNNVPLPVELTDFSSIVNQNDITLHWETATEVNNYGFEVERQIIVNSGQFLDEVWEKIAFIEGNGNSNSSKYYSFEDKNVLAENVNYRLKQIDIDGGFEYSDVIECEIETPELTLLKQNYPNPFNPQTAIEFTLNRNSFVKLNLYNSNGELISSLVDDDMSAGYHKLLFDISSASMQLSSGVYYYQLIADKFIDVKKMILLK